jgi:ketosteroid isomerase-like protein
VTDVQSGYALAASDREQLLAARRAYVDTWLGGDPAAIMATLTDDAVLLPHHGLPPVVGAVAIRHFWWPAGAPPPTIDAFEMTLDEAGGSGSFGYARGRFRLVYSYLDDGERQSITNEGNDLMLFRRCPDGRWRISHHMWGDPAPAP